jgi:FecR protein
MTTRSIISVVSVSVISVVALVGVLLMSQLRTAHDQAAPKPAINGPGVVRVSIVDGSAVVQSGESRVQTSAVPNAPMLPGDYISTGKTSRAELQFDGYTAVRLGGSAQVRIVSSDPNNRKVQLADGTVEIGMVRDGDTMQIDTPSVTVRAHQTGDVRISIAADGSSWVTARRGGADVVTPQRTYTLGTGTTLIARGSASDPSITNAPEVAFDAFDDFNAARDRTMVAALNASPNLNPSIAGYDDLSTYGQWRAVAGYGQSWVPNEPAGWAPYRNGSWTWEGGYGWTWIGSEPWGWTPYHYGNWFYCNCSSSGWAWLPPSSTTAPSWAPALVGFFEFNTGQIGYNNNCYGNYGYAPGSVAAPVAPASNAVAAAPAPNNAPPPAPYGVGGPSPGGPPAPFPAPYGSGGPYPYIGWVPIAPSEPFYPWYPGWAWLGFGWGSPFFGGFGFPRFVSITHITNITNITRIYRNFRHGGATATTFRNFRHGTIHGRTVAVDPRDIGRVGTIHGALPVHPTRANTGFSHGTLHAPVAFSKAFDSPRFASDKALAAATRGGLTGHVTARAAVARANAPVSHTNAQVSHANAPVTRPNATVAHANVPETHANTLAARPRENAPVTHANAAPAMHANSAPAIRTENSASMRENNPAMRENDSTMRENDSSMRESGATAPANSEARESAPSTSWERFDDARGVAARSDEFQGRSEDATASEAGRDEQGPSDSWGRFSASRGGESYDSTRNPYDDRGSDERGSYGGMRNPYDDRGSDERGSYGGMRNPYDDRGSYPSYSRGSYPSYSRGSYPSYSRGSYPSYSRGSYPSYSRGSYGSGPSYSRGGYSAPHSSGGGGGGGRAGGGGRPPR